MTRPKILLASNSSRRSELLGMAGWDFDAHPVNVDESLNPGETPREYVTRLALSKARLCEEWLRSEAIPAGNVLILAADTTVVHQGDILGKPADVEDAIKMLQTLRGKRHQVLTAISVIRLLDGTTINDLCTTDVFMRNYGMDEMEAYVASGDPLDKAGAYGIQNRTFHPVASVTGCFASVMGLPLCHLSRSLQKLSVLNKMNIATRCLSELHYDCPISSVILNGEMTE